MIKLMQHFLRTEKGATAIEYGLICALMVVVIVGAIQTLGAAVVNTLYNKITLAF